MHRTLLYAWSTTWGKAAPITLDEDLMPPLAPLLDTEHLTAEHLHDFYAVYLGDHPDLTGVTLDDIRHEIADTGGFGPTLANEVTAYLLGHGDIRGAHGIRRRGSFLLHTLACGINWSASRSPRNRTWELFGPDPLAPAVREPRIQVELTCACGAVGAAPRDAHWRPRLILGLSESQLQRLDRDGTTAAAVGGRE